MGGVHETCVAECKVLKVFYSYIELFNLLNHNDILKTLGSPYLWDILNINSDYHSSLKDFLWELGENTFKVVLIGVEMDIWEVVCCEVNMSRI